MTPEQATLMIDLLMQMNGTLLVLEQLFTAVGLGVGFLMGQVQWHLIIQAKNQSSLF